MAEARLSPYAPGNPARTQRNNPTSITGTPASPRRSLESTWDATPYKPDTFSGPPGSHTPGQSHEYAGKTTQLAPGQTANPNQYGSQSGPGILEQWFNQRATGSDPAFDYGVKRGMRDLGDRYAAAGAFNSGAARQGESDLYANLLSQRMGQLDSLAAGASGEHLGRLGLMFNQGLGLAGGQAGLASAYDLGAAGNMQAATQAQQQMAMNKAGVDQLGNQSAINLFSSIYGGRGGGGYGR